MFRLSPLSGSTAAAPAPSPHNWPKHLGWNLWDKLLTEEIARLANVDPSAVKRCDERMDSRFYRLAKTFWRGSYERSSQLGTQTFDTDCMMAMMEEITAKIAQEGNAVVVGRGAPFFLREHPDAFHVFLYAPRAEKIRRLMQDGATQCGSRRSGRYRRSRTHRLRETLFRRRLAHSLSLSRDDQYGDGK